MMVHLLTLEDTFRSWVDVTESKRETIPITHNSWLWYRLTVPESRQVRSWRFADAIGMFKNKHAGSNHASQWCSWGRSGKGYMPPRKSGSFFTISAGREMIAEKLAFLPILSSQGSKWSCFPRPWLKPGRDDSASTGGNLLLDITHLPHLAWHKILFVCMDIKTVLTHPLAPQQCPLSVQS